MTQFVFDLMDRMGAIGVGLLIFLENVIPPIPSEVILPLAGFRARTGALDVVAVWIFATLGALLGALLLYGLGAWLGYDRLHALAGRKWFIFSSQKDLERGHQLFDDHGGRVVLIARCIPLVRSVVSIPAGIIGMPLWKFLGLSAIGSGLWNAVFVFLGWQLGENWGVVEGYLGPISYAVVGLLLIALVWLIVRRRRSATGLLAARRAARDPFNR